MADYAKAGVVLYCTLVILSLVHLVLADWSPQVYEEYRKKPLGRKLPPKRAGGYYSVKPFYDEEDDTSGGYEEEGGTGDDQNSDYYYRPSTPAAHRKPYYYRPKPTHYKHKPKPITSSSPAPFTKPAPGQEEPSAPPPSMYINPPPPEEERPPQLQAPPMYAKPPAELAPPPYKRPYTPPTPTSSSSSSWAQQWLGPHNAARAELGLPPMAWSDKVAQFAESWANQRKASGCGLQHSNGPYGENIFWASGSSYGPAECVAAWVSEKEYYNYAHNSCAPGQQCGHYTQIVWATSLNLGCAKVQCDSGQIFMTCNYDPPGNWIGSKPY